MKICLHYLLFIMQLESYLAFAQKVPCATVCRDNCFWSCGPKHECNARNRLAAYPDSDYIHYA
jgi:hypothetical protein